LRSAGGARLDREGFSPDPRIEAAIAALKGFPTLIWLTVQSSDFPRSSDAGDAVAVPALEDLADRAAAAGLRVALYPHTGYWVERVEDAVRLARKANRPNLGVTFNLCHWLRVDGRDLEQRLEAAMPWLYCGTINGASTGGDKRWAALIQPLDRGEYDWADLVRSLLARGYNGPVCLQLYGVKGNSQDNLKASMDAWRVAFP